MKPKMPLRFNVLGVGISPVQIPDVISQMETWIGDRRGCHSIAVTGMHGVTEAQHDSSFKEVLNAADLLVPDGMPLVWLGRMLGFPLRRRVYGPELMIIFCNQTKTKGYRHFLYGGDIGVADKLALVLHERFPGLVIAGVYSPPFRPLSEEEDRQIRTLLNESHADVLYGLAWARQSRSDGCTSTVIALTLPCVVIGVGAAFDFRTRGEKGKRRNGCVRTEGSNGSSGAPAGAEERLWQRYLIYGSEFAL